ncbi:MAG: IS91 family transposase [Gemmatimonadales bacterium]
MPCAAHGSHRSPAPRPALDVADIVRAHGAAYRREHALSLDQRAVLRAIATCRTPVLGGHLDVCDTCGHTRPAYNCHCPKCQALRAARWVDARMARLLPTPYFHVVFTLPAALRGLVLHNRRRLFALLFAAASQTLLTLGHDPRRLGATLGLTAVLHTWTRDLQFHPHVHYLVTGGGLAVDRPRWIAARRRHLFPVRVLSRLFRGKLLAALARARARGELQFPGAIADLADAAAFRALLDQLYHQEWVVYAKRPFGGPTQVFHYLGRYTHRVGLSNHRLQAITPDAVRFATKDGRSVTLPPCEFLRRFLLHVLPAGFVKIRHFGLFAARQVPTALTHARRLLAGAALRPTPPPPPSDWRTRLRRLTGVDLARCPRCARGTMIRHPLPYGAPVYAPP